MGIFTKQEIKAILISIIVLAVVFGLNDKRETFEFGAWSINLLGVIVVVSFSLLFREYARKFIARRYGAETEVKLWSIERFWFTKEAKFLFVVGKKQVKKFPVGVVLPLLISLFSFGRVYVPSTNDVSIKENKNKRVGRKFLHITELETGVIALSGAMASLFLAFVFSVIGKEFFSQLVTINLWMALFSFVPFGKLDGTKIFFGSRTLYVISLAFTILFSVLLFVTSAFSSLIIGVIGGLVIALVYFYLLEFK
ncbi:MAG: hypothetical protein AB1571_04010 [Nanoarchaeota archaeon]